MMHVLGEAPHTDDTYAGPLHWLLRGLTPCHLFSLAPGTDYGVSTL